MGEDRILFIKIKIQITSKWLSGPLTKHLRLIKTLFSFVYKIHNFINAKNMIFFIELLKIINANKVFLLISPYSHFNIA